MGALMARPVFHIHVGNGVPEHIGGNCAGSTGLDQLPLHFPSFIVAQLAGGHFPIIYPFIQSAIRGVVGIGVGGDAEADVNVLHIGFLPFCPPLGHSYYIRVNYTILGVIHLSLLLEYYAPVTSRI